MEEAIRFTKGGALDARDLQRLLVQVDWAQDRKIRDIEKMLAATSLYISAWKGDGLVGFLRVITDWTYRALIEDVIVDKGYRNMGIGEGLVGRALECLVEVQEIVLGCTEENVMYYERFGFHRVAHPYMQKKA